MGDPGATRVIIFLEGKGKGESNMLTVGQVCISDDGAGGEGITRKVRQ